MPKPRRLLVDVDATFYYHGISGCVRRAFLCGQDRFSGRSVDHRKPWVVQRLRELAAVFALDVVAVDVLANRSRSQGLLDMGAVLACMSYGDLNEIRVGLAETVEDSEVAFIRERLLVAARKREAAKAHQAPLVPFRGDAAPAAEAAGMAPLPIPLGDYVELLKATGGVIRRHAVEEPLPDPVQATVRGLGLDPTRFVAGVRDLSRSFFTMIGHVARIDTECRRRGYRKRRGITGARRLYRQSAA